SDDGAAEQLKLSDVWCEHDADSRADRSRGDCALLPSRRGWRGRARREDSFGASEVIPLRRFPPGFLEANGAKAIVLLQRLNERVDGGAPGVQVLEFLAGGSSGGGRCFLRKHSTDVPDGLRKHNREYGTSAGKLCGYSSYPQTGVLVN